MEIAQTWQLANQSRARCRLNLVMLVFPVVLGRTLLLHGLRFAISVRKVLRRTAAAGIRCRGRSRSTAGSSSASRSRPPGRRRPGRPAGATRGRDSYAPSEAVGVAVFQYV